MQRGGPCSVPMDAMRSTVWRVFLGRGSFLKHGWLREQRLFFYLIWGKGLVHHQSGTSGNASQVAWLAGVRAPVTRAVTRDVWGWEGMGWAQARGPGPPSQPKEGTFDNFHISSKFGDFCPCWSLGRPLWESMWKPLTTEGSLPFLPGNTRALRRHSYFK